MIYHKHLPVFPSPTPLWQDLPDPVLSRGGNGHWRRRKPQGRGLIRGTAYVLWKSNRLIAASLPPFLLFHLPVPLAPTGFLRLLSMLHPLFLSLRSWRLPYNPRLHPLFLHCRSSLLWRGLVRWLRAWTSLLSWSSHPGLFLPSPLSRRGAPVFSLLPWASHPRLFLSTPLGRRRCSLHSLLLKVLADRLVARLITIMLAA